jgi:hypothetical protein
MTDFSKALAAVEFLFDLTLRSLLVGDAQIWDD